MKKHLQISVSCIIIIQAKQALDIVRYLRSLPWETFTARSADEFFTYHITKLTESIDSGELTSTLLREAKLLRTNCEVERSKYLSVK